jgi:recombinational DNA repair protein (RecF pathway)
LKWTLTQEVEVMKCERCGREIFENERYEYLGETLCEDCYIDMRYPSKACDPWAVYSATRSRVSQGLEGTAGLTDLQRAIYDFVKSSGKVTREEMIKNFNLAESELQAQLATLRHCELIKGYKEDDKIYLIPFDQNVA